MIPNHKKNFPKIIKLLEGENIKFKYYPRWETCIIKKGKLKVEIDEVGTGYKTIKQKTILKTTKKIDFYGTQVNLLTLKQLIEMYPIAYNRSTEDKARIKKKIKHLEKFLGRKLK